MVSHDEDRHLRAIEQWFETEDPALARMFRAHEQPPRPYRRKGVRTAAYLAGAITFTIGALISVGAFIVLGTLLITVAVCLHLTAHTFQS